MSQTDTTMTNQTAANQTWVTKDGRRRVKQALPTLDEAIFAAKGITDDLQSQTEIAASLMGLPHDEVRAAILKSGRSKLMPQMMSVGRNGPRAVVVERVGRRTVGAKSFVPR